MCRRNLVCSSTTIIMASRPSSGTSSIRLTLDSADLGGVATAKLSTIRASSSAAVLDQAAALELIQKSGAHYSMDGTKFGHGRDNALNYLKEHETVENDLRERVQAVRIGGEAAPSEKKKDGKAA